MLTTFLILLAAVVALAVLWQMAALAAAETEIVTTDPSNAIIEMDDATPDTIYAGGLVGINASGFAVPWDDVATTQLAGLATKNSTSVSGASPKTRAHVDCSGPIVKNIPVASAVQGSVGLQVHCTTDNVQTDCVLDAGATSRGIGVIIRFGSASDCDIKLYSIGEWFARYLTGAT
jgi:hypothetical protein